MAVAPSHGDAEEGIPLSWRGLDQLEAMTAESERSALGQQQPTLRALLLDDLGQAPVTRGRCVAQLNGAERGDGAGRRPRGMAVRTEDGRFATDRPRQQPVVSEDGRGV